MSTGINPLKIVISGGIQDDRETLAAAIAQTLIDNKFENTVIRNSDGFDKTIDPTPEHLRVSMYDLLYLFKPSLFKEKIIVEPIYDIKDEEDRNLERMHRNANKNTKHSMRSYSKNIAL